MTTTRFDNVGVGEMFKYFGCTYIRIEPMTDGCGDDWNALNLDREDVSFFYNEDYVEVWN